MKDDEGHEHGDDGKFVSTGGGGGKSDDDKPRQGKKHNPSPTSPSGGGGPSERPSHRRRTPALKKTLAELKDRLDNDKVGDKQIEDMRDAYSHEGKLERQLIDATDDMEAARFTLGALRHEYVDTSTEVREAEIAVQEAMARADQVANRLYRKALKPLAVSDPVTFRVDKAVRDPLMRSTLQRVGAYLSPLVSEAVIPDMKINAVHNATLNRPQYNARTGSIELPQNYHDLYVMHELGHVVELRNPRTREVALDFLDMRCEAEKFVSLGRRFPTEYNADEWGRKDEFDKLWEEPHRAYYVGKYYDNGDTEMITTGLEKFYTSPIVMAAADPEYFKMLTGILSGRLL